ncbi:DUF523 domain-containing protein [Clostridium gasigenes]|uniref:DUF523 domain-containing protein n=1 Tax=Clostridium gasigenes TaxID=94869 RepID=UPI001C0D0BC8|nr:DUF523 domain-containing protein [Clostridium gasigenes]MBU3106558.1 DUF523 domain-containing protein [Clostridium gasigenes]MBU3131459.1 DUF523 domain-containing protein [Clostridium gasigenes]MBU3134960.1 DUF523 domain-containing protein [Clostridium gasigenes]
MYLISACLCGVNCKYNGGNNFNEKCLELFESGKGILICPEEIGGLSTPRLPAEIKGEVSGILIEKSKIINNKDEDVSENFIRGAKEVLKIAKEKNIHKAILKEGSPSCGVNFIYDGNFNGNKINGCGLTTYILKENGINVISEEQLGGV